jgi:hypothetical protein
VSGHSTPVTPTGPGIVKLWYGPATGLAPPAIVENLSHQPAKWTTRSVA